jgi:hypothetical protein
MWLRGVQYTFITSMEAGIDIAAAHLPHCGWGAHRPTRAVHPEMPKDGFAQRCAG